MVRISTAGVTSLLSHVTGYSINVRYGLGDVGADREQFFQGESQTRLELRRESENKSSMLLDR